MRGQNRRQFLLRLAAAGAFLAKPSCGPADRRAVRRPNILLFLTDDQSWLHAGAYGDPVVRTPAFDRIASEGVRFENAYCGVSSCGPSRASILTGRHFWQLGHAANHWSLFPAELAVFPDVLESSGYWIGFTGKGWGPDTPESLAASGRTRNPAGPDFNRVWLPENEARFLHPADYAANFEVFLEERPEGAPFFFWAGAREPHVPHRRGAGLEAGLKLEDVVVPPYVPDHEDIRGFFLNYYHEIEYADAHLARMLASLEKIGELEDTLIVATSDNGMAVPRGKGNCYDWGTRMPMAVRWGSWVPPGRVVEDFVNLADLAPTFLDAAGVPVLPVMSGRSLMPTLESTSGGLADPTRTRVFLGKERHDPVDVHPMRAIRTAEHLYIRNLNPGPFRFQSTSPGPALTLEQHVPGVARDPEYYVVLYRADPEVAPFFESAYGQRPAEELYILAEDPHQLHDVAREPRHASTREALAGELQEFLRSSGDPRARPGPVVFDDYRDFRETG